MKAEGLNKDEALRQSLASLGSVVVAYSTTLGPLVSAVTPRAPVPAVPVAVLRVYASDHVVPLNVHF